MTRQFPARLHVLLASKAPIGVVFRGARLAPRGRIYERRADFSPDAIASI